MDKTDLASFGPGSIVFAFHWRGRRLSKNECVTRSGHVVRFWIDPARISGSGNKAMPDLLFNVLDSCDFSEPSLHFRCGRYTYLLVMNAVHTWFTQLFFLDPPVLICYASSYLFHVLESRCNWTHAGFPTIYLEIQLWDSWKYIPLSYCKHRLPPYSVPQGGLKNIPEWISSRLPNPSLFLLWISTQICYVTCLRTVLWNGSRPMGFLSHPLIV